MVALRNLRQFIKTQERKLALKCTDEHATEIVLSEQARLNETKGSKADMFHLMPFEQQLDGYGSAMDYIPTPRT